MSKKFLLIVEGKDTEKSVLKEVLSRYGYNIVDCDVIDITGKLKNFDMAKMVSDGDEVFIAQGPRNRIHDWLKLMDRKYDDFERFFEGINGLFAGIFIIYDVDHNSTEDISTMFEKYSDETTNGLLLLNSPCIEVVADAGRESELKVCHLKEYKKSLNKRFSLSHNCSAKQFIIDNFEELVLYYLDKNCEELGCDNVVEHPSLILSKINTLNERVNCPKEEAYVCYRYFTTVMYVSIAFMKGLTKEIDNSNIVRSFFESCKIKK